MKNVSLRLRLVLWYSAIVAITLLAFGTAAYITVSQDLYQNLDASLQRVSTSLDYIIQKKQSETMRPLKPAPVRRKFGRKKSEQVPADSFAFFRNSDRRLFYGPYYDTIQEPEEDPVWSAVYEHILLNPRNFYIQIADLKQNIVWRSDNLGSDSLPVISEKNIAGSNYSTIVLSVKQQKLRLYSTRTRQANITVGYTLEEVDTTLYELFISLLIGFPLVLLISTLGGWFLARVSLRPIDDLARSAHEITASNLSNRLPEPRSNDEVARLTHTLNEMIARLEDSFNQIKQFTADVSHELRTPLAILTGELEVALRSRKSPEEYKDIIISALEEVGRLSKVVRTLLDLSRAETGQVKIGMQLLDLSGLLEEISEDAGILAEEKHISMGIMIQPGLTIMGDDIRMHQALLNVLDNAIKYTPDGGDILIRLVRQDNQAVLRISDSGIGISEEHLPHIFDRFFRADQARSQDIQGNGLGLSIVKWIIEAHQGMIKAESTLGKGTLFTIILPLAERQQSSVSTEL
jgi:heavy metal sensor kinase